MATFKVGQRVKRIRNGCYGIPIGTEGTVLRFPGGKQTLHADAIDVAWDVGGYEQRGVATDSVVPLIDPKAEQFIERVKSWKPEPEAIPLPVKAPLTGNSPR